MILQTILSELKPYEAQLVAVSKFRSIPAIQELYDQGQRDFGENRVQELIIKQPQFPEDVKWHIIGHLQTNKVKLIAPFVHLIHSVDSARLLKVINSEAKKNLRVIDVLLQFKIAEEDTKYGFDLDNARALLEAESFNELDHIRICGVMGMATFTDDKDQVQKEFKTLKDIYDSLKNNYFSSQDHFKEISMGMSGDYLLALAEGSTMVRVGSKLFQ